MESSVQKNESLAPQLGATSQTIDVTPCALPPGHMYFQEGIKLVADMMEIDDHDADWIVDAEFICKALTERMSEIDWIYKYVLQNLLNTATFFRGSQVDLPLDFDQYLRFQIPFQVTPIFNPAQPGYIKFYTAANHAMVNNNYLNPEAFQLLLRGNLRHAIQQLGAIYCNNNILYELTYRDLPIGDQGILHEILAYEKREFGVPSVICFSFLPALQFNFAQFPLPTIVPLGPMWSHCNNAYYWLALLQVYPCYDNRSFCAVVPRMQLIQDERMVKYRSVLRLLLRIGWGNALPDMSDIFMLKGLHFYRHRYAAACDCNLSLATLFKELLNMHTEVMYSDALLKFLTYGGNQTIMMRNALKLDCISRNVTMFYYLNNIHVEQLKHIFGIF